MDDHNFLYYIIIGVIYLLSRVLGKKKKPVAKRPAEHPQGELVPERGQKGPLSFEDILKELSGESRQSPKQESPPATIPVEQVHTESFDTSSSIPPKLEEPRVITKRRDVDFARKQAYKIKESAKIDYLDVLDQEDGPAKAFVLSEIFNRKY